MGTEETEMAEGKTVGTMEERLTTTRPLSLRPSEILNTGSIYISSFQLHFLRPPEKLGNKYR